MTQMPPPPAAPMPPPPSPPPPASPPGKGWLIAAIVSILLFFPIAPFLFYKAGKMPKKAMGIATAVLVVAFIVILATNKNSTATNAQTTPTAESPSASPTSAATKKAAPAAAAVDPNVRSAKDYISAHHDDILQVDNGIQAVQAGAKILAQGNADQSTLASFDQLCQTVQSSFTTARDNLLNADDPSGMNYPNGLSTSLGTAADSLNSACDDAIHYFDTQATSDLAKFGTDWNDGLQAWTVGIQSLYGAANEKSPI